MSPVTDDGWPVGEVARLAGVSVRALHHYDEIGLLRPNGRTHAGHRRYDAADLERLRTILYSRELDFGLDEIATMLADPRDAEAHLRTQHRMLRERVDRDERLLRAIEKEMEARRMGISLTPEEQFEIFGSDKFTGEYAQEAERRWRGTDAWQESQRRAAAYTKQDWIEIKTEADRITEALAAELRAGRPADGPRAMELAEEHRQHISRRFYECRPAFHRNLAEMYMSDERFRATYEAVAPGLAEYVHDAIVANAEAHGA